MFKKKLLTALLSTALIGSGIENTMDANMDRQATAQSHQGRAIVGDWSGVLETGIMQVNLVLHIHQDSRGALSANFDTLEHSGTPIDEITFDGRALKFEIKRAFATFEGLLNESTISGQFVLAGQSYSLAFERGIKSVEAANRPQEPKAPFPYTEEHVFYDNLEAGVTLSGTLTVPASKNPSPVVLLIPGSGPLDRDEALCPYQQLRYKNIGHRPFLVLADYLTRQGIAVLRLDKRGCGESTGNYDKATTQDFASDVFAGVAYLKSRKEINPNQIGLIGHSEGGIIAPMVAAGSKDLAFIVLMAAPAVTGEEIMYEQSRLATSTQDHNFLKQLCTILKKEADPQIAAGQLREMAKNHRAALEASEGKVNFNLLERIAQNTQWWRHFLLFDPAAALKQVKIPVLALTGELDLQASPTQNLPVISNALEEAGNKDFTIVELPSLNHFFQTCQDGSFGEYAKIEETISPSVLNLIAEWILERTIQK
jgi:pimeloyl-ACP methyl ester carboxylesterase